MARVVLKEDSELLDEVVVIGYGTERKSDLSTAVSQVKSKDFESISYSDPGQAIAGRMPEFMSNKQVEHRVAIHRFLSEVLEPLVPEVHLWLL